MPAALGCGYARDQVGIDVGNHIQPTLVKAFGARMGGANTAMMEEMVKKGMLGRKSGKGFFLYDGNSKNKEVNPDAEELIKKYHGALRALRRPS